MPTDPRVRLDAIRQRADKAAPGPWFWAGNISLGGPRLATWNRTYKGRSVGQVTVMDFVRQGMQSAQPRFCNDDLAMVKASDLAQFEVCHAATSADDERVYRHDIDGIHHPDAEFIAHARQDVPQLVAALEAVLDLHVACDVTCDNNGVVLPIEEPWCDADGMSYPCPTVRAITDALGGGDDA